MKPARQFNRGHAWYQRPTGRPHPLQHVESKYEDSADDETEHEDDHIGFHSDESDENDGVEDETRFHSHDEPQLASEAL